LRPVVAHTASEKGRMALDHCSHALVPRRLSPRPDGQSRLD